MVEDAFRIFNGEADGVAGLVIDKYGDVLIVQLHEERLGLKEEEVRRLVEYVHERLGTCGVYKKIFVRDRGEVSADVAELHTDSEPWIGRAVEPELIINERGLRFVIRPYDGFSVGLFLEHRENRRRISELSGGRRVLNTFCYTCGFSMAAARGGAVSVDSVDSSKHFLQWGKKNFGVNDIDMGGHLFSCSDVFDFYKRAGRQGRRYDLIVLDPPTFSRSRRPKRVFELKKQLDKLTAGAVELLEPGGIVFLATNCREISRSRLEESLVSSGGGRRCEIMERPGLPIDFANDPEFSKMVIGVYT